MPGRVFISYSKAEPEPTRELADFLTSQGYTVWWDTNLTSGEVFRKVIDRELAAADAVIVIWSAHSVASNWVVSEADDAARRGKLITVRTGDLEPWRIPKPYNTYQADLVDNREAVLAAVRRVAGEAPKLEAKPAPSLSEATLYEALALEHWQAIKASGDPAKLQAFLNEFGTSKCGPLARAELARLAERQWSKLASSKDPVALNSFCSLFQDTPQARLARARMAALNSKTETKEHAPPLRNGVAGFVNRHPRIIAFSWLFIGLPLIWFISRLFVESKWLSIGLPKDPERFASGYTIGLVLFISAESFLLWVRFRFIKAAEVAIYCLGNALVAGFLGVVLLVILDFPIIIGSNRYQTALSVFVAIAAVSGISTWITWRRTHHFHT